jgi:hypothetical protein
MEVNKKKNQSLNTQIDRIKDWKVIKQNNNQLVSTQDVVFP